MHCRKISTSASLDLLKKHYYQRTLHNKVSQTNKRTAVSNVCTRVYKRQLSKTTTQLGQRVWKKHPSSFFLLGKDQMTIMLSMEPQWALLTPPLPPPSFHPSTPWSLKGLHMFMAHACGMTMDSPYKSQQDHGVFQILLSEDSCWQNDSSHIYFGQRAGALSGELIRDPPPLIIRNAPRAEKSQRLPVMTFSSNGRFNTTKLHERQKNKPESLVWEHQHKASVDCLSRREPR